MNFFKEASKRKLRFTTSRGELTTEQLWTLPIGELSECIRSINESMKKDNTDGLSFLENNQSVENEVLELKFNVAKEVYIDRIEERNAASSAKEDKMKKQRILEIIKSKEDEDLHGKSIDELKEMLNK